MLNSRGKFLAKKEEKVGGGVELSGGFFPYLDSGVEIKKVQKPKAK